MQNERMDAKSVEESIGSYIIEKKINIICDDIKCFFDFSNGFRNFVAAYSGIEPSIPVMNTEKKSPPNTIIEKAEQIHEDLIAILEKLRYDLGRL